MNIKQRRLPSAYQEVEYIKTDGYAYIDLGFAPNADTDYKYEMVCQMETFNQYFGFFGAYEGEAYNATRLIVGSSTGVTFLAYCGNIANASRAYFTVASVTDKLKVTLDYNSVSVYDYNNQQIYSSNLAVKSFGTDSTATFRLFRYSRSNTIFYVGSFWESKVWKSNVLIRDVIPCYRVSDSVIGMYDTVNGMFYTNQGTGSFTKGADVVTVDSITIPQTGRRIPSAYQECEWIGFDGASCLALNNTFSLNDLTVKGRFISTGTGERCLVGMGSASTTYFEVFTQSSNNTVRIWDTSSNVGVPSTIGTLTDFTATWDNGTKTITSNGQTASGSSLTGNLIVKIGTHREGAYWFIGQVHSLSFESTNSSAILVPCYRISDSVIGMYDIINDVFYTNQGSGTFTKGNDVVLTDNNVAVIKQGNQRIWQRLPWEYQEVEWIGGNYDGQTILPVHTSDTSIQSMTFEADVFFDSSGSGERALGFGTSGLVECYIATDSRFCYWVSGAGRLASVASVTNEFVHFKLEDKPSGGQFIFGNTTVNFNSALSSLSNYKGVQIFGYSTSSYLVKAKMKEARLTIDGQNYHLVPCYRKSDNVVGMYDLVSGTFKTNRLTGNFIKGNDL